MVGSAPPGGTFTTASGTATGGGWVNVYTVPSGKKLYWSNIHYFCVATSTNIAWLEVADATPTMQYRVAYFNPQSGQSLQQFVNFQPAFEIPAGWSIRGFSGGSTIWLFLSMMGWLFDA